MQNTPVNNKLYYRFYQIWNNPKTFKKIIFIFYRGKHKLNNMPLNVQKTKISSLENYVCKIVSVPLYGFLELCVEVSQDSLKHLHGNQSNFFLDSCLQLEKCCWASAEPKQNIALISIKMLQRVEQKPPLTIPGMHTKERTPSYWSHFPNLRF